MQYKSILFPFLTNSKKALSASTTLALTLLCLTEHNGWADSTEFPEELVMPIEEDSSSENQKENTPSTRAKAEKFKKMLQGLEDAPSSPETQKALPKPVVGAPLSPAALATNKAPLAIARPDLTSENPQPQMKIEELGIVARRSPEKNDTSLPDENDVSEEELYLGDEGPTPVSAEKSSLPSESQPLEERTARVRTLQAASLPNDPVPNEEGIPETALEEGIRTPSRASSEASVMSSPPGEAQQSTENGRHRVEKRLAEAVQTGQISAMSKETAPADLRAPASAPEIRDGRASLSDPKSPAPLPETPHPIHETVPQEEIDPIILTAPSGNSAASGAPSLQEIDPSEKPALLTKPYVRDAAGSQTESALDPTSESTSPASNVRQPSGKPVTQKKAIDTLSSELQNSPEDQRLLDVPADVAEGRVNRTESSVKKPVSLVPQTLISKGQPIPLQKEDSLPVRDKPLPKVTVEPHPEIKPLSEDISSSSTPVAFSGEVLSYSSASKDRAPIAILDANQAPSTQQWVLYSSVKRGMKSPSDHVDIVSLGEGTDSTERGEAVKDLLIQNGIDANQIRIMQAQGEEGQAGKVYLFIESGR